MTEPAAQQSYRVPRSELDRLFATAEPTQALHTWAAIIVSIDGPDTVTVLMHDEEVHGVLVLGDIGDLAIGDAVEVQQRGDLLVIPDWYREGVTIEAAHVVSDESPELPAGSPVPIGDSMRDLDAWQFYPPDTTSWLRELDSSGVGMHVKQVGETRARTNMATVPSAEAGLTDAAGHGWVTNPAFGSYAVGAISDSTLRAKWGTHSVLATWPASDPLPSNVTLWVTGHVPDRTYTATLSVWVPAGSPDVFITAIFLADGTPTNTKGQWVDLSITYVATQPDAFIAVATDKTKPSAGGTCHVDGLVVVEGSTPVPYFDGSTAAAAGVRYAWDGTPHLSTSGQFTGAGSPAPATTGTLWSSTLLNVAAGDTFDLALVSGWYAGAQTSAQLVIAYSNVPDTLPDLATSPVTTYGAAQGLANTATPVSTAWSGTVPDTITMGGSPVEPTSARIGLRLANATKNADLQLQSIGLHYQGEWPLGSLWLNPAAEQGGLAGGDAYHDVATASTVLPTVVEPTYLPVPIARKAIVTAPPTQGGVAWVLFTWSARFGAASPQAIFRIYVNGVTADATVRGSNGAATSGTEYLPFALATLIPLAPGETAEAVLHYTLSSTANAVNILNPSTVAVFMPGSHASSLNPRDTQPAWLSMYDGDSWLPNDLNTATIDVATVGTTVPPTKTPTTTTIAKSNSSLQVGDTLTLTSTTTPTAATGTVTFEKASSTSGPWSSIGSKSIGSGSGTATLKWDATAGTWYFRARYAGSTVHAASTSSATSQLTVTKPTQTTKTVTRSAMWIQPYNGGGTWLNGSGHDSAAHQGYYSATHGNRKTLLRFDANLPADAEVTKVTLTCSSWAHWYYNAGGTLRLGWHDKATKPTNYGVGGGAAGKSAHSVDTGSWTVNITGWADTIVKRSDFCGLVIGPGSGNSLEYYGYSADSGVDRFKLNITFRTYT